MSDGAKDDVSASLVEKKADLASSYGSVDLKARADLVAKTATDAAGKAADAAKKAADAAQDAVELVLEGPENPDEPPLVSWKEQGTSLALFTDGAIIVGKHSATLGLIALEVIFSKKYLMNCDERIHPMYMSVACEATKGWLRCFPLMAVVVSTMVAGRQILQLRMYYELLKRRALLDMENFNPLGDPLFRAVCAAALTAALHFALAMGVKAPMPQIDALDMAKAAEVMEQYHKVSEDVQHAAVFFMVPTAVFIVFLFNSYDVEANLVRLNKYLEEDPEEARKNVAQMPFLSEKTVANVIEDGGILTEAVQTEKQVEQAYARLVSMSEERQKADKADIKPLSNWRLVATLWPAKFLFHRNLQDSDNIEFRNYWLLFSGVVLVITMGASVLALDLMVRKINDVITGQWSDLIGAISALITLQCILWMGFCFMKNSLVPFQSE